MRSEWPQPGSVGPSAPSYVRVGTRGQACHLQPACRVVAQGHVRQRGAEHIWPVLDEPLANRYFGTLADLEQVVTERCRILSRDQLKPGTNSHWWPKPDIPA